jgi:hypothetical protein
MYYKWERRDKKLIAKKRRMKKSGKNLGQMYANSVRRREEEILF